ncbi:MULTISPECIES: hypothetical protein [Nocardia]|uniref:hypothetical protein n=1 Tax=Nocardia TaxID=1817 RepID=UPI002457702E|nr:MULTISPECIES: hypothetical protein [Nocardia]
MVDRQHYQKTSPDPDRPGCYTVHICDFTDCAGRDDPRHHNDVRKTYEPVEIDVWPPPGRDVGELVKPDGPLRCPDCDELESCCVCIQERRTQRRLGICTECGLSSAGNHYPWCSRALKAFESTGPGSRPCITCSVCGRTSHNSHDIVNRYCGHCHLFLTAPSRIIDLIEPDDPEIPR